MRASSDTVASNCPINMWISGGDDISFAIPDFGNYAIAPARTSGRAFRNEVLDAQVFNLTGSAVEHNEQVASTASQMFPKSPMDGTKAEELSIGEKISSLRQLIKRFGITSVGQQAPYRDSSRQLAYFPGPLPLNNDDYLLNEVVLDPAYFGDTTAEDAVVQTKTLPYERNADGSLLETDLIVAKHYPNQCPLFYISYLYRFFRGGRRYKMVSPPTNEFHYRAVGFRAASAAGAQTTPYAQALDEIETSFNRSSHPLVAKRDWRITENGVISGPLVSTFLTTDIGPEFEHYVYPDLNGTLEFEVPYYAQTPISLVGEGTLSSDEGPLVRRSKIRVRRSQDPRGMDSPGFESFSDKAYPRAGSEGIRAPFGAYTLYEAAADDFSFGYLIGAPTIRRIVDQP